jgi:hypothetical protein
VPGKRIVLLEMDKEAAEAFVRSMTKNDTPAFVPVDRQECTVQAVVAKPVVWCKCDVGPAQTRGQRRRTLARRESGWSRGKALGWWICAKCKKPSKAMVLHFVTAMLAGANDLLPQILDESATPLTPSERWRLAGGIPNPHENGTPIPVIHQQMADVTPTGVPIKRKRKVRRSDVDRATATSRYQSG